jgi:hypothetical protein
MVHEVVDKRRRLVIGRHVVEGPIVLYPSHKVDELGYLEPCLKIHEIAGDFSFHQSMILFVDTTDSRDRNFLTPMLRHAVWEREKDSIKGLPWPHVKIKLGMVSDWNAVKRIGREIQRALQKPPIIDYGHSKTRCFPDLEFAPDGKIYTVYTNNGSQSIEFSSFEQPNDDFTPILRESIANLKNVMTPIQPEGWRECYDYDYDLTATGPLKKWEWKIGDGFLGEWEPIDQQVEDSGTNEHTNKG